MVSKHERFALHDLTFAGLPVPGATIDRWLDDAGNLQWSARLITRALPVAQAGQIAGLMRDGRRVSGYAVIADRQGQPGGNREHLLVFHGSGDLAGVEEPEPG